MSKEKYIEKMKTYIENNQIYIPTFPQAWNKLCPQGWAWLIGDCDFGQNCGSCNEEEAPIYQRSRGKANEQ